MTAAQDRANRVMRMPYPDIDLDVIHNVAACQAEIEVTLAELLEGIGYDKSGIELIAKTVERVIRKHSTAVTLTRGPIKIEVTK